MMLVKVGFLKKLIAFGLPNVHTYRYVFIFSPSCHKHKVQHFSHSIFGMEIGNEGLGMKGGNQLVFIQ